MGAFARSDGIFDSSALSAPTSPPKMARRIAPALSGSALELAPGVPAAAASPAVSEGAASAVAAVSAWCGAVRGMRTGVMSPANLRYSMARRLLGAAAAVPAAGPRHSPMAAPRAAANDRPAASSRCSAFRYTATFPASGASSISVLPQDPASGISISARSRAAISCSCCRFCDSAPKATCVTTPRRFIISIAPYAKYSALLHAYANGSSSTRSMPFSAAILARVHLSSSAGSPLCVKSPLITATTKSAVLTARASPRW